MTARHGGTGHGGANHDSWQSWTESARGEEEEEYHSGVDENPEGAEQDPWAQFDHHATSRGTRSVTEDEHWKREGHELLPDFLQGWYLLQDASLDGNERNMVQTALQGDFSLHRVAQELRVQWPEDELRRRDQGNRAGAHWNDEALYGEEEWESEGGYWSHQDLQGLNDEGREIMWVS